MSIHISGWVNTKKKKRCQTCQHFCLWGTSYGACFKKGEDVSMNDKCKYHKRDQELWTKDGKSKLPKDEQWKHYS